MYFGLHINYKKVKIGIFKSKKRSKMCDVRGFRTF